ncbi:MAG: hypothetical protein AAFY65_13220 [Pseudomonadota bacterium]
MGSRTPRRDDIEPHLYPVRLTIRLRGNRLDHQNRLTNAYLSSVRHGYYVQPARLPYSADRVAFIYLPNLKAATDLILACPHLELVADRYHGTHR